MDSVKEFLAQTRQTIAETTGAALCSYVFAVDKIDLLLAYEAAQKCSPAFAVFYQRPESDFAAAAWGKAWEAATAGAASMREAAKQWDAVAEHAAIHFETALSAGPWSFPIAMAGFAFDPQRQRSELWQNFPDASVVAPEITWIQANAASVMMWTFYITAESSIEEMAQQLASRYAEFAALYPSATPAKNTTESAAQQTVMRPMRSNKEWMEYVSGCLAEITNGAGEKIVPARAVSAESAAGWEITAGLDYLRRNYPAAVIFAIARSGSVFMGATPERLGMAADSKVYTMALAGSAPRGATADEDEKIEREQLFSLKNMREHRVVSQSITTALRQITEFIAADETPKALKLHNVQHLLTHISGKLQRRRSILDVVEALHPTPAVAGLPQNAALRYIRNNEALDRGWYAAPIGWLNTNGDGEFWVALRSGIITGANATLFAGCGVVRGSLPEDELRESEIKLQAMKDALRIAEVKNTI